MTNRDVIIACDFSSAEETFRFLDLFKNEARKPFLKIGMELFYAEGPEIVREIKRRGHRIFLDLKLHDIPNTVKKAMAVLSRLDVDMCNVHAAGTIEMMRAAVEGLTRPDGTRPLLIAVTQLTSTSEERMQRELLISASINDTIVKYAQNTREAGLAGGRYGEGGLRKGVPDRYARRAFCGRRGGRSGAGHDSGACAGNRLGLYRGWASHHGGSRSRGGLSPVRGGVREIECATVGSISGGTEGRAALRPGSSDTDGIRVVRQLSKMGLGAWSSRNFGRHGCCRIVRTECAPNCGDRRGRLPRQARNKFYSKSRKL